jgi:hypothetical protein
MPVTQQPPPGALGLLQATATLSAVSGASTLTATGLIPANVRVHGVLVQVLVAFGTGLGLTGLSIGGLGLVDGWGSGVALTLGTTTTLGAFRGVRRTDLPITTSTADVVLTAEGGVFAATGSARVIVYWSVLTL